MKSLSLILILVISSIILTAQENPVKWNITQADSDSDTIILLITADIHHDWYIYGMNMDEGGPLPLLISIENQDNFNGIVNFSEITPAVSMYDEIFEMNVSSYTHLAQIKCEIPTKTDNLTVNITIDGQACNKVNGSCIQVYENIAFEIKK